MAANSFVRIPSVNFKQIHIIKTFVNIDLGDAKVNINILLRFFCIIILIKNVSV